MAFLLRKRAHIQVDDSPERRSLPSDLPGALREADSLPIKLRGFHQQIERIAEHHRPIALPRMNGNPDLPQPANCIARPKSCYEGAAHVNDAKPYAHFLATRML